MKPQLQKFLQLMLLVVFLTPCFVSLGQGQKDPNKKAIPQTALDHIKKNRQKLALEETDIADLELSSETNSKKSGVKHLYIKQLYQGIEIHGSITNISLSKEG